MTGRFKRLFGSFGEFCDDYLNTGLQLIATVGLVVSTAASSDEFSHSLGLVEQKIVVERSGFAGIFIFALLAAFTTVQNVRRVRRNSELQQECDDKDTVILEMEDRLALFELNIQNLVDGYLYHLATQRLRFGEGEGNTDRISIYLHDSQEDRFYRLGRYSANPDYRKSNKGPYEPHRGCIYAAWRDDWFFDATFPDPKNRKQYQQKQSEFKITKSMVRKFAMHPRMYCGRSIKNDKGTENIAVLVIESTLHNKFTEQELREALATDAAFLTELAVRAKTLYAKPSYVQSKGF